jgi:arylformamidase
VERIDLSHPIEPGMTTYLGLPAPKAKVLLTYEQSRERYQGQAEFFIASLHLCGNTGTYVDAPRHRYRDGADLAALSLDRLAHLPTVRIDASRRPSGTRGIGPERFKGVALKGRAVLVQTNWSERWRTDRYFDPNPFLTRETAQMLVDAKVALVGIDSVNIDDIRDPSRPAHTLLLGAGIPICEHLTGLAALPRTGSFFHAVPIPWVGGATFPVRAYALVEIGSVAR